MRYASLEPEERDDDLFSAFIQDEIALAPERWSLILGSKFEHNDYTGFEYQPNARLLWTPDTQRSLWASVTRAVRTPGRADRDLRHLSRIVPPGAAENPTPLPLAIFAQGDDANDSEVLMAYEAGFKFQATGQLVNPLGARLVRWADTDGFVDALLVEPGATVPAGTALLRLRNPRLQADIAVQRARLQALADRYDAARGAQKLAARTAALNKLHGLLSAAAPRLDACYLPDKRENSEGDEESTGTSK